MNIVIPLAIVLPQMEQKQKYLWIPQVEQPEIQEYQVRPRITTFLSTT